MNGILNCKLVGYSKFNSKDKTKVLFVIQCLYVEYDKAKEILRSKILDVFVNDTDYETITQSREVFSDIQVEFTVNPSANKIYYQIIS